MSAAAFVNLMFVFTFAFQAAGGAFDEGFSGSLHLLLRVWCLHAHDMQVPVSTGAF